MVNTCVGRRVNSPDGSSLRRAVREFIAHYHAERNHQGLDNRIIQPDGQVARAFGPVRSRERLGGMLRYYYRDAA